MALGKLLNFSVPYVPVRYNESTNIYNVGLLGELSKIQVMTIIIIIITTTICSFTGANGLI